MNATIRLADALKVMDQSTGPNGEDRPFDITFVKYGKTKRQENGRVVELKGAIKTGLPFNVKDNMQRGLKVLATGERKTCNIHLITHFNGATVKW